MMVRTSGSVGALIIIGGKARAMKAKGRHQTTPSIAEGFLGERELKLGLEGRRESTDDERSCRFLLEWSIKNGYSIWHCVPSPVPNLDGLLSLAKPFLPLPSFTDYTGLWVLIASHKLSSSALWWPWEESPRQKETAA